MTQTSDFPAIVATARETGKWDRASINALMMTNDRAVEKALACLLSLQTSHEQQIGATWVNNSVGFSSVDAAIFTGFAKRVRDGRSLSPKQMALCRKSDRKGFCRLSKYHAQLIALIPAKQPALQMAA